MDVFQKWQSDSCIESMCSCLWSEELCTDEVEVECGAQALFVGEPLLWIEKIMLVLGVDRFEDEVVRVLLATDFLPLIP